MISFSKGWVNGMSKCPFWSTASEKVNCYKGCPMQLTDSIEELCVFKEHLVDNKVVFKEIVEEDFAYNYKENYEYNLSF